ncbi:hypothetical protein GCM10009730_07010 [Streptomyces albidochromogenes]|uniref:hypothetical protein n=1 Tax=Streptomyces albidochromogenes TaxID=329524 RepID=UPI00110F7B5A|nr:hypothetical protein [Streptomyces albidochromogenes]
MTCTELGRWQGMKTRSAAAAATAAAAFAAGLAAALAVPAPLAQAAPPDRTDRPASPLPIDLPDVSEESFKGLDKALQY